VLSGFDVANPIDYCDSTQEDDMARPKFSAVEVEEPHRGEPRIRFS